MANWTERAPYAYWKGNPNVGAGRRFLLRCNASGKRDWNARIYAQVHTSIPDSLNRAGVHKHTCRLNNTSHAQST
jgi:hypothetical protein